jgi:hypothetical protein
LNFLILLPAVVVSALLLAGMPVVKKTPAVRETPQFEVAREKEIGPAQPIPEPTWIDASQKKPVEVGNVLVQIDEVRIGVSKKIDLNKALEGLADLGKALDSTDLSKPLETTNNGATTEQPALLIQVRVGNPNETIKLEFKPWSKTQKSDLRLTDNFRNNYKPRASSTALLNLGGSGGGTESIKPVTSIVDTLAFEDPVNKVQFLRLELPAENFGGTGYLYFQIPRSMIQGMR